jgi:hypothetical protein
MHDKLRARLKEDGHDPDIFAPKVNGGVILAKVKVLMHDTCNTANSSAVVVARLTAQSGEEYYGAEVWASLSADQRLFMITCVAIILGVCQLTNSTESLRNISTSP